MQSQILDKLKWRYATKKFNGDKKLSKDKIAILKDTFNLTATSYGLQPLKMLVISNQKIKESLVAASYNQKQLKDASHVLVLCVDSKMNADFIKDHFARVEKIQNTNRTVLEPFENFLIETFTDKSSEEVRKWMINQLYLILGALLTVCAAEEIDSCPMEGFEPDKYDMLLNLKEHNLNSVLVLPVGYRADDDLFAGLTKVRRGVEEVVIDIT